MKSPKYKRKSEHKLSTQTVDRELSETPVQDRRIDVQRRRNAIIIWDSVKGPPRSKAIYILNAPNFAARGIRCIYGCGDHFGRGSYGMDVYLRKDGRVLLRFTSPANRTVRRTYEIVGLKLPALPAEGKLLDDSFVPEVVRDLYNNWVQDCLWYPDDRD